MSFKNVGFGTKQTLVQIPILLLSSELMCKTGDDDSHITRLLWSLNKTLTVLSSAPVSIITMLT